MHMKIMQDIGKICMKKLAKTKIFCKHLFWWESETAQKQRYPGAEGESVFVQNKKE